MGDNQHLDKPPRCLFPRQTARRSTSTCSVRAYLSQRRIITSQSTTTLIPRTSTSSRLASPLPPADTSRPNSHGNITTPPSPLRVLTTSANGFTSPPRLSQLPTSSNNDRKPFGGRGGRGGDRGGDREGGYRRRDAGGEGKEGAPSGEFAPQFRGGFGRGAGRGG